MNPGQILKLKGNNSEVIPYFKKYLNLFGHTLTLVSKREYSGSGIPKTIQKEQKNIGEPFLSNTFQIILLRFEKNNNFCFGYSVQILRGLIYLDSSPMLYCCKNYFGLF